MNPSAKPERLHHLLQRSSDRWPTRTAVLSGDEAWSYRQLENEANRTAAVLREMGLGPGDRVALSCSNDPRTLALQMAVSLIGASFAMLNPGWKDAEVRSALSVTRPALLVADGREGGVTPDAPGIPVVTIGGPLQDDSNLTTRIAQASPARPADVPGSAATDDVALPFSSGTTGLPKAVRHTHRSILATVTAWNQAADISHADRLQLFLPLFHVYGLVTATSAIGQGATLRLIGRFSADEVLESLERDEITVAFGAAPIAVALGGHPSLESFDLSSLRYMVWGATPVIDSAARRFTERTGVRWLVAYGATEAPVMFSNPASRPDLWRLDSVGTAATGLDIELVKPETTNPVRTGQPGELRVRGEQVMAGYLPAAANADVLEDGWLRTGDIGVLEDGGWLRITDRAKELIKVNGFQVAPAELEQVLHGHPDVADCAVYGVPDERTGEAPRAAIVRTPGATVSADALIGWAAGRLASYKQIRSIAFVDQLPRTTSGKLQRQLLRSGELSERTSS